MGGFLKYLWDKPFFVDKSLKLVKRLFKISNASQDAECLFLCPLFSIIFDAVGLRVLFAVEAMGDAKEKIRIIGGESESEE